MEEINEKLHMKLLNFDTEKRVTWVKERKPFSVLFELTARCNMNCIHCYLQNHHCTEQLTYDEIIEVIDILYDKGILFLTFTGGEILTRSDFLDIYIYAKKKGFLVELFTNGYLFNDKIINALKEYPPLLIDISIYGANEETYHKVTGIEGAFDKVIENCKKLKAANLRVSLKSPIIKENINELDDMKKIADKLNIPFVYTFEITPTIDKDNRPRELQLPIDEILRYEFLNYYEQIENGEREKGKIDYDEIIKLKRNDCVYACNVALNSFVIDYQGRMCPCMKLRHKGERLNANNYDDIWQRFRHYSAIKASDSYKCNGCDSRYYCDICPAEMDLMFDNMEYRPDNVCIPAKVRMCFYENQISIEDAIKKYL